MCQCGCSNPYIEHAYELPNRQVVAYDVYHGCDQCFSGPGLNIYVYPNKKSEWLRSAKIEQFKPDEYGGDGGSGIAINFFEVTDLKAEANEMEQQGCTIGPADNQYATLQDWLDDFGLDLIQGAMRRFQKRMAVTLAELNRELGIPESEVPEEIERMAPGVVKEMAAEWTSCESCRE
jgi:hypothetical protein